MPAETTARVRVWDLPTRLFHWLLALLILTSIVTAKVGGNAMDWHMWSGYAVLALLVFRLLWGWAGSRYARFESFVRGPQAVLAYLRGDGGDAHPGHNPLGAWSVVVLLLVLLTQGTTGLFANDDIATEGPLAKLVSSRTSTLLSSVHRLNEWVIYALVALHLLAVAFYAFVKRQNLVFPMLTGDKTGIAGEPAEDDAAMRWRAAILFAIAAGLVAYLVQL
jgi:cytochrome b